MIVAKGTKMWKRCCIAALVISQKLTSNETCNDSVLRLAGDIRLTLGRSHWIPTIYEHLSNPCRHSNPLLRPCCTIKQYAKEMKAYTPHLCGGGMQMAYLRYIDFYASHTSPSAPHCLRRGLLILLTFSLSTRLFLYQVPRLGRNGLFQLRTHMKTQ